MFKNYNIEKLFPTLVIILSSVNIIQHSNVLLCPSTFLSLIGIVGAILFFLKNSLYKFLFYIWILAQILLISKLTYDPISQSFQPNPYWNLEQTSSIGLSFFLSFKTATYFYKFNVLATFYLAMFRIINISRLVGKNLNLRPLKDGGNLDEVLPLNGNVIKRVRLDNEKDWLLLRLEKNFDYNGEDISHILIKSKGDGVLKKGGKNQVVYVRLVPNINDIEDGVNPANQFPFADWAFCS